MFSAAPRQRQMSRKKDFMDKENASSMKTPRRPENDAMAAIKRNVPGTVLRDTRNLMGTTNGKTEKGKCKEAGDGKGQGIEPTRLFKTHITASKSASGLSQAAPVARQTPAPSRTLPTQTPLPSAGRTSRRSRQSFATPVRQNGWEDELAAGNVSVEAAPADVVLEGLEEESDGEVEYMPPKAVELPYEPPFQHPDLAAIGRAAATRPEPRFSDPTEDFVLDFDMKQATNFDLLDVEEPLFAAAPPPRIAPSSRAPSSARPNETAKPAISTRVLPSSRSTVTPSSAAPRSISRPAIRKPALPSTTRPTTKLSSSSAVPRTKMAASSAIVRKPLAPVTNKSAASSLAAPARKAPLPARRPLVPKPKADPLADLGINFDDVLADIGNDDFEFTL